jgi:glutathione S-transferase
MFKLYTSAGTGGFAAHAVLEEAGARYRIIPVDTKAGEHRTVKFLKLNPLAQVPVLELPNGEVMTESAAMVIYLCDRLGVMAPAPSSRNRARFLRWLLFLAVNTYTADLRAYYSDRFSTEPGDITGIRAAAIADMDRQFAIVEKTIGAGPFLLGRTFSALDVYLVMLIYWHPEPEAVLKRNRAIATLVERVKARKSVKTINAFHQLW